MEKIKAFIRQFTDSELGNIIKIGRRYYMAEKPQLEISGRINRDIFSIGIYLGETRKEFRPTPALLEIIAKHSNRKAYISKKTEWLFLCGRDVFAVNIEKRKVNEGVVLVQNEKDENLGYGEYQTKGKKRYIKNLMDRGYYLRREN